jgi:endonuclease/exonuclease/phosphatase family metal-dependent hydrolase
MTCTTDKSQVRLTSLQGQSHVQKTVYGGFARRFIVTFLLAFGVSLPAAPVTQLKVLSFNIWVQGGLSLNNCIEAIRTTGADLVGLQECNTSTAQSIANSLGFFVQPDGDASIVSRYPLVASLPTSGGRGVTIQLSPGQRVHLFNCHLTPYPYGPYDLQSGQSQSFIINQENQTRMPALTSLLAAMAPFLATSEPCFLTGDFNAPSHFDYTSFPWPTSIACTNAGLSDAYAELHPGNRKYPGAFAYNEPGITWTPKSSQEPNGVFDRIDFVHYSQGDGVTVSSAVELDERNSINPWPSDHRAVLSSFTLTPPVLLAKASSPSPAHNATNVALNPTLSWLPGSNATSHAVYFATDSSGVLITNTTEVSVPLTNLLADTVYYWHVNESTPTGTVTGDVWSFTTKGTNALVYEWNFANGNLAPALGNGVLAYADGTTTSNLTTFGTTDGTTVPHISGNAAKFLHAPAFNAAGNGFHVTFTDSNPNGGGSYINQFTMIFDVLLPGTINWFPFFNTNPGNANDADFYVNSSGALGIAAIGYSASDIIAANTWYRVAFAADLAAGTITYYRDGNPVYTGSATLDGRHSLYSSFDSGPDLLLFNEGDTSGVYTHEVYLSSFCFTPRSMSASEILALGSPKAHGILAPAVPLTAAIELQTTNILLSWSGGESPYQIQKSGTLTNPSWHNLGPPSNGTNAIIPRTNAEGYFRVLGQ